MSVEDPSYKTPKENLRATRVFYLATVIGIVAFLIVAIIIDKVQGGPPAYFENKDIFHTMSIILAIVCFIIARSSYRKGIQNIKGRLQPLNEKLNAYRTVLVRYVAFCEMPAIFSIIVFIGFGEYAILFITAIMIVSMMGNAPITSKVVEDLDLTINERNELE